VKSMPRILPLVGVAIGGVLAVNALSGARDLPGLLSGAQAFAEEATKGGEAEKPKADKPDAGKSADAAATGAAADAAATGAAADAAATLPAPTIAPRAVCAPTAAELAKQAGLSPAELQVLQSLGARRGQLDARENNLDTQLALMAAAEAKVDAKIRALNGLKAEVNGLLNQSNAKEAAEIDRLVKVFEGMKAKDAAPRLAALDDNVRIPIAAKMKERSLSAIIAQMSAADAKKLTESLARRYSEAKDAASKASTVAEQTSAAPSVDPTQPAPKKQAAAAARKAPPRKKAPAAQTAAAKPAAAPPAAAAPAAAPPAAAAAPPPAG
jgi:flagellar motility protein MotE (MotC chaperone)